ncbi:hypothetical protein BO86DRAFT_394087 [Aspergillus japonicus CBS 114.51]|uniref:Mid2 domain-containing protein n=1 Tax=Aspergillus japonicus CBS 114.51 TaxID=1448312 RepID=A0A8T8XG20_ASPJA|nr:hypothetical protein BO86DRAFT_394087 [Aspergillus japonicus CBS 114.51]RAH87283.1 hypothetical protein BO86DRAFT_394087 [Aspergillus japonicus CBS 114.51]
MAIWSSILLLTLTSEIFRVTDDIVSIYDGLTTTWTYNSTDPIKEPMEIAFFQISHLEEGIDYTVDGKNITAGIYTLQRSFTMADGWYLRYTFGDEMYLSGRFQLTLGQPSNASASSTSPTVGGVTITKSTLNMISTSTGDGSTMQTTAASSSAGSVPSNTAGPTTDPGVSDGLSTGSKAGIGVGCAAAVIIGVAGLYLLYRARKKRGESADETPVSTWVAETSELDGGSGARRQYELEGSQGVVKAHELPAQAEISHELPG